MIEGLIPSIPFYLGFFWGFWCSNPIINILYGLLMWFVFDKVIKLIRKMRKENSNDQI